MKKILTLSLALMTVLLLVACSSDADKDASSDNVIDQTTLQKDSTADVEDDSTADIENETQEDNSSDDTSDLGDPQGNSNLISIGTTATATFENRYGVKTSVSMCVDEVIRGDDALAFINDKMMAEKSMWTAEAPEDDNEEYIVTKITFSLLAYDDGDESSPSYSYAYSSTFEPYPNLLAAMFYDETINYPNLPSVDMKVGDTITGYEIFQVSKSDDSPLMAYSNHLADFSDGLWFKLY